MSEYWKSVPRKFCDFCKCWITDNKPSVDFHERGKRHQENVQKRLKEVRKKSYEQSLEDDQVSKQMEKMEKAALEAFKKDLAADPQLAKQYGVSLEPKPKPVETPSNSKSPDVKDEDESSKPDKEWYEAKAPEGYSYYWSAVTGESRWEAPDEYVSIEEQEEEQKKEEETTQTLSTETDDTTVDETSQPDKQTLDPSFSRSAFGAWNVVREESRPVIYDNSIEAPLPGEIPLPEATPLPKSETPKFKEKTVKSLAPSSSSTDSTMPVFKKRKITSGARNSRQRGNDD